MKRVTALGLGLALSGGLLAACEPTGEPVAELQATDTAPAELGEAGGEGGEAGEAGEAGEGEGGVVVADAAEDPVVFIAALAVAEAHAIAARDAHALGEADSAAEMFAHPVSEVLLDMEPVFAARGVTPFDSLFLDASMAIYDGESPAQISARTDAIIAALRSAAERAPETDASAALVWAGVAADQIDRAADMYRIAQDSGEYGPYLDGYGFYMAGRAAFEEHAAAIAAERPEAAARITEALARLAIAYPDAGPQQALPFDRAELNAVATQAVLAARR